MAKAQSKSERPETGFKDVEAQAEQAEKDAQQPLEVDDDGKPVNLTSEAGLEVAEERAFRAGAQVNGGGPWPPELLRERYVGNQTKLSRDVSAGYTSHEGQG